MKNYVSAGRDVTLTAPSGGVTTGTVYLIGSILCVAASTVAAGLPCVFATLGVFKNIPKTAGQAFAEGALLYWDDTNKALTTTASTNKKAGTCVVAALSADTICNGFNLNNYVA
jgi:predicted RecA/RadA family phage recombinase